VYSLAAPAGGGGPWKETVLHRFKGGNDGAGPVAEVIFDARGVLYGTAALGIATEGSVFRMKPPRRAELGPSVCSTNLPGAQTATPPVANWFSAKEGASSARLETGVQESSVVG
jgi:hypothetical protein